MSLKVSDISAHLGRRRPGRYEPADMITSITLGILAGVATIAIAVRAGIRLSAIYPTRDDPRAILLGIFGSIFGGPAVGCGIGFGTWGIFCWREHEYNKKIRALREELGNSSVAASAGQFLKVAALSKQEELRPLVQKLDIHKALTLRPFLQENHLLSSLRAYEKKLLQEISGKAAIKPMQDFPDYHYAAAKALSPEKERELNLRVWGVKLDGETVTFKIGQEELQVEKQLAYLSDVFQTEFTSGMQEAKNRVAEIEEEDRELVELLQKGQLPAKDRLLPLLQVILKRQVKPFMIHALFAVEEKAEKEGLEIVRTYLIHQEVKNRLEPLIHRTTITENNLMQMVAIAKEAKWPSLLEKCKSFLKSEMQDKPADAIIRQIGIANQLELKDVADHGVNQLVPRPESIHVVWQFAVDSKNNVLKNFCLLNVRTSRQNYRELPSGILEKLAKI